MLSLSSSLTAAQFCATEHRGLAEANLAAFLADATLIAPARRFAVQVWEPFLDLVGGARMTSGFRSAELNAAVGGSRPPLGKMSAHVFARAGDCVPCCSLLAAMDLLKVSAIRFDKALVECAGGARWLHLQVARADSAPRQQLIVAYGDRDAEGRLVYQDFDPGDPRAQAFA